MMIKHPNTNPPTYERNSQKMAELARDYHYNLQTKDLATVAEQVMVRNITYRHITTKIAAGDKQVLDQMLNEEEIAAALREQSNGKAAGMDGISCELWKTLQKQYELNENDAHNTANICKMLTAVYNDIEKHGVIPNTDFSLGWMCPIYKKGDKREIANYRPITVLNTDHKILTKALNNRISKLANKLIHPDQTGFVPGRSIFDSIKQTKLLISYAEIKEEDGIIVGLDQEKAYDKIRHEYL
jgi:hypothetical protein